MKVGHATSVKSTSEANLRYNDEVFVPERGPRELSGSKPQLPNVRPQLSLYSCVPLYLHLSCDRCISLPRNIYRNVTQRLHFYGDMS